MASSCMLQSCCAVAPLYPLSSLVSSLSPSSANEPPNIGKVMMGMPIGMGMPMPPPKLPPRLQTIRSSQLKLHLPGGGTVKLPSADASK